MSAAQRELEERDRKLKELAAEFEERLAEERRLSQAAFAELQAKYRQLASDNCEQKIYWEYWKQPKLGACAQSGPAPLQHLARAGTGDHAYGASSRTTGDFVLTVEKALNPKK